MESEYFSDRPIEHCEDDLFGRADYARTLSASLLALPGPDPFVIGISGPWGSGKTSVLNMLAEQLNQQEQGENGPLIFRFNPWWFSGSDALLESFLHQFATALSIRTPGQSSQKIAKYLKAFGAVLRPARYIPVVGTAAGALGEVATTAGAAFQKIAELSDDKDAAGLRQEIDKELKTQATTIVVLIDDIDRLLPQEAVQLVTMVKAVADFPWTRYVLAYDRQELCKLLGKSLQIDGAEFLEKIVQLPLELPPLSPHDLSEAFRKGLNAIVAETPERLVDKGRFGAVYSQSIAAALKTPRSAKRLLNVLRITYPHLRREVDFVDFLGMRTLELFFAEAHRFLIAHKHDVLRGGYDGGRTDASDEIRKAWENAVPVGSRAEAQRLMSGLFPRFGTVFGEPQYGTDWEDKWSARLRICSERHFDKYLALGLPKGRLSEEQCEAFVDGLSDARRTDAWLCGLIRTPGAHEGRTLAGDALETLNSFARPAENMTETQRAQLLEALLRTGDTLLAAEDREPILLVDLTNCLRIIWLFQSLLGGIPPGNRCDVLRTALQQATAWRCMLELICFLGGQHGKCGAERQESHEHLVDAECVDLILELGRTVMKGASGAGQLSSTGHPLETAVLWTRIGAEQDARTWLRDCAKDDGPFLRIVSAAVGETRTTSFDTGQVQVQPTMHPGTLLHFFEPLELRSRAHELLSNRRDDLQDREKFALEKITELIHDDGTVDEPPKPFANELGDQ